MTPPTTLADALAEGLREADDTPGLGTYQRTADHLAAALLAPGGWFEGLANDGRLWDSVCGTLAQIADRNMPGWDAGEMTTAALRTLVATLRTTA